MAGASGIGVAPPPPGCWDGAPAMNIHHLELFYYVAKHGGISRAVRNMPYGIQQPAVSSQILNLEEDLGTKLFERTPFRLTSAGEELFAFAAPFFDNLDSVGERLRKTAAPQLRIGASELALREHLPAIIGRLRAQEPKVRLSLRSGFQPQIEAWLLDKEIDVAVTPLDSRPPARLECQRLLRVPLVLLVPKKSRYRAADELWAGGMGGEPLIMLPMQESASRIFQKHLKKSGVDWPVAIEASSLGLITQYVANGYGVGVNVDIPSVAKHRDVRALPLPGVDPIEVAMLWRGEPAPLIAAFIDSARSYVRQQWPGWAVTELPE